MYVLRGRKTRGKASPYEGWVKLRIKCGDPHETLSWVMGFGSNAVIVSPKSLKNLYRDELIQMAKRVGGLRYNRVGLKAKKEESPAEPEGDSSPKAE
jgi:hypothetical protein